MEKKKFRFHLIYLLIALFGVALLHDLWVGQQKVAELPYSEFRALLEQGKVSEVVVTQRELHGVLKEPVQGDKTRFVTSRVDRDLVSDLEKHQVKFSAREESTMVRDVLGWVLPMLLFFGGWLYLSNRMKGGLGPGLMSIGKSKAKVFVEPDTKVTFADVAGVDEAKAELVEIVDFLKNPKAHGRLGGRMPRGVLWWGRRARARRCWRARWRARRRCPSSRSTGRSSWRCSWAWAPRACAISSSRRGSRRRASSSSTSSTRSGARAARRAPSGATTRRSRRLNQLLVELDGFDPGTGLVLIAATNRPEILDPALLSAGRFDRQVLVDRPDKLGRVEILRCT
jgi:cell division protease FtsH